jgi:hypothetical protein
MLTFVFLTTLDNFFFREQRNKILETGDGDDDNEKKKSFEDIGRVIGQRWREIAPEELAKYQDLAKQDAERYRKEMKVFYEEELALMCSGQGAAPPAEDDKAADQQADHKELMLKMQQQLQQRSASGQERFVAMSPSSAPASTGVTSAQLISNQATTNVMDVEQLVQLQNMLQTGNKKSFIGKLNKAELANEISAQRAAIQQRLVSLLQESEMLRVKDRLLEQLFSNLSEAGSGNSSSDSGLAGSIARPAPVGLNPFPQAACSHASHAAPTPVANNFGLGGAAAASMMMPSLGHLLNQPQQTLTADNASFINQLIAHQQQQQLANMGASAAAASFTNQSSTTSDETSDQASAKQNNQAPMNLQALLGQNGNGMGNVSQGQGAGAFGLAGSTFNAGNATQPPPDVAALIAQLMQQQNQNKPLPGS